MMRPPFRKIQLRFEHHIPFMPLWTVNKHLSKNNASILDVGCGTGELMAHLTKFYSYKLGIDAFRPYLETCRKNRTHDDLVLCDASHLPIRAKTVDVVFAIRLIEHISRRKAYGLLADIVNIARHQVLLCIPVGDFEQDEFDDNPFQLHRSFWYPEEFEKRGYTVIGNGIVHLHTGAQLVQRIEKMPKWKFLGLSWIYFPAFIVWAIAGMLTQFFPRFGANMVCIKQLEKT